MPALPEGELDLASRVLGAEALACSDMFFSPMNNLLLPGRSFYMGGGWETRRSRPPGMDWIIVRLCGPGRVERVVLDTGHFKGNYPDRASIDGLYWPDAPAYALPGHPAWEEALPSVKLRADTEHEFKMVKPGPWTHLRLKIYPDGGVARLRAFGMLQQVQPEVKVEKLNALGEAEARAALLRCCGSGRWVEAMLQSRPFKNWTELLGKAEAVWWHLGDGDWKEAFTHHPRIGADAALLREKFAAIASWSASEQSGMSEADEAVIQALAAGNRAYEERFGYIFIVCATGLSAREMLYRLEERLPNEPASELRIAAGEQAKITALRLAKLEAA
jgi:allantoicase